MFQLEYSGQFKRDFKRMVKRGADVELMRTVLHFLENDGQVPASYKPHTLSGNYQGIWECHIEPDWLLMYDISNTIRLIRLVRTGTHSDLFRK